MRCFFRTCLMLSTVFMLGVVFNAREARAQTPVGPGDVLISEFRLSGPGGDSDEYIEFYCNRDTDCDLSGYNIGSFNPSFGDFINAFPAGSVIRARQFMLVGDDFGYSLSSYASLDLVFSFGGEADFFIDNQGLQLTTPDESTVIDSVGFIGGGGLISYIEGTGLQQATGARPADQYAYVRKQGTATNGIPQDTNNNANDFVLVSVTGAAHPGITNPPVLGAPGPQGALSPTVFTQAAITDSLVEPGQPSSAPPNRVRTGSGNSGTLSIRRSFTNNTDEAITYLAFRVVDITTLNSPNVAGAQQQAQLRLVTSGDAETFTNSQGRTVVIHGTLLEFDDGTEPNQPNGGGLNSSAQVDVGTIAPGETVDVQCLFNVVQSGYFRFFVVIEGVTSTPVIESPALIGAPANGRRVTMNRTVVANSAAPARRLSVTRRRVASRRVNAKPPVPLRPSKPGGKSPATAAPKTVIPVKQVIPPTRGR